MKLREKKIHTRNIINAMPYIHAFLKQDYFDLSKKKLRESHLFVEKLR